MTPGCGIAIRHRKVERRQFRFLGKGINQFPASAQTEPVTESKTDLTAPVRQRLTVDQAQIDPMTPVRPTAGPDVKHHCCRMVLPRRSSAGGDTDGRLGQRARYRVEGLRH